MSAFSRPNIVRMNVDTTSDQPPILASQMPRPFNASTSDTNSIRHAQTPLGGQSSVAALSSLSSPPRQGGKSPGIRRYNSDSGAEGNFFRGVSSAFMFSHSTLTSESGRQTQQQSPSYVESDRNYYHRSSENNNVVYSDRFIPSRNASDLENAFDSVGEFAVDNSAFQTSGQSNMSTAAGSAMDVSAPGSVQAAGSGWYSSGGSNRDSQGVMNSLLRSELLGQTSSLLAPGVASHLGDRSTFDDGMAGITGDDRLRGSTESAWSQGSGGVNGDLRGSGTFTGQNVLKFRTDRRRSGGDSASISSNTSLGSGDSGSLGSGSGFGLLPSSPNTLGLGSPAARRPQRKISKSAFKVLDAPALQDDYYLNLVDWSSTNVLGVGLGSSVYLWSACTSKVTKLCDTGAENAVTSICWSPEGTHLAVGTNCGKVHIWDVQKNALVRDMCQHGSRVGTAAWSSTLLATGSRDRMIKLQDARVRSVNNDGNYAVGPVHPGDPCVVHELIAHKQEVCGLKWSPDEKMLASGGNDNKLYVWALNHANPTNPICRFSDHNAAVKAVAWSPHQSGLLASGGGTADRHIRFWNAQTGLPLHRVDTGSQVCNLMWSKNVNEIVSTHGYSLNQIIVWKYPSMNKIATLTGHSLRVLYLAMSPDGQAIVTGAGDETLRFWNVFPGQRSAVRSKGSGLLFPGPDIR